jgi:glycosyltransferase involved in cell wall biosynthesis
MNKRGHQIVIAAPKDTPLFLNAKEKGFKVYAIEFNQFSIIKDYKILKNIFHIEKPDIINTHGNKDSKLALFAAKKAHVPLRILSRHISAHVKNSWYNRMVYKKWCHFIFTTADYTTKHLKQVFKLKDMQVFSMPSGIIEPNFLLKKAEARQVLAKELGLDPKTRFIGFVGRVSKDKGVSCLVEAFKKVRPALSGYHVAIVGGGTDEYINLLKELAKTLGIEGYIHFTGFKKNVWQYYRALDCKILPSMDRNGIPFEGIPQSLLEAMICNCPVIGSKSGGIVDIIDHERTGLLFDTGDPFDLAQKIRMTLKDKDATQKRVDTALDHARNHHTIDTMGRNILRIYKLHQLGIGNTKS